MRGASAAFAVLEDRGASFPRGVAARFGWSKKLKSSSLKCQGPLALQIALNETVMAQKEERQQHLPMPHVPIGDIPKCRDS